MNNAMVFDELKPPFRFIFSLSLRPRSLARSLKARSLRPTSRGRGLGENKCLGGNSLKRKEKDCNNFPRWPRNTLDAGVSEKNEEEIQNTRGGARAAVLARACSLCSLSRSLSDYSINTVLTFEDAEK